MKSNISSPSLKKAFGSRRRKTVSMPLKKIAAMGIAASLLCVLLLAGCTGKDATAARHKDDSSRAEEIHITASFYPLYIMLMNITENAPGVQLHLMAPADTGCLHHYHLSPADMELIQDTDIMVVNGADMEEFMDKVLDTLPASSVVTATGDWPVLDHNPHVWVSPAGAIHQVQEIAAGLSAIDPENGQLYRDNADKYVAKLQELLATMHSQLDPLAGSSLVTFHEAFPYLAQEFNFNLAGSIQREPDSEPTARELVETVTIIRDVADRDGRLALFAESGYASSAAEVIARETGLAVYQLDPAVTGVLDKDAYIRAMEHNARVLKQALEH